MPHPIRMTAVVWLLFMLWVSPVTFAQMQWTCATQTPGFKARTNHTSVAFKNNIWVFEGGGGCDKPFPNDIWRSANGTDWTCAVDSAIFPMRVGIPSVIFNNRLWFLGGWNGL